MPSKETDIPSYLDAKVRAGTLHQKDADLLILFIEERKATHNINSATAQAIVRATSRFIEIVGVPCCECTYLDVIKGINAVKEIWKANTRRLRIYYLKELLLWLINEGYNKNLVRKKIEKIVPPKGEKITKNAEQMIGLDKVDEMIRSCRNSRDRALLAMCYEGALRPSADIRTATWDQVTFDEYGVLFTTNKKTGKVRRIRYLIYSQYIVQWRNDYPLQTGIKKPGPNDLIFPSERKGPLGRQRFDDIIKDAATRAGIEKFYPYLLRHSRITEMVIQNIPEGVIKEIAWGNQATPMMATYTHLSNDQVDTALMGAFGLRKPGRPKKGTNVKPLQCPICQTINVPNADYCTKCMCALNKDAATNQKSRLARIEALAESDPQCAARADAHASAKAAIQRSREPMPLPKD